MIIKENDNRIRLALSDKKYAKRTAQETAEMVKVFRGEKGEPGRGIKDIEQVEDDEIILTLSDGVKSSIRLPRGKEGKSIQGKPGPKGSIGKQGKSGKGIESITQPTEDTMKITFTDGTDVTLELPRGRDGREIELRATATHLQWRYVGQKEWKNLLDLTKLMGVSEGAGSFKIVKTINGATGDITISAGANVSIVQNGNDFEISATGGSGGGDVTGPAGATANAIAIYNGITGKIIKNSGATIDGSGNITATNFSGTSSGNNSGDQDLSPYALIASLALVAFSGDYNDLINLPTLVTDHGALTGLLDDDHPQYHTDARALTWLGTRSTSDLPEGSNLYFTDERAQDAVGLMVTDGSLVYVDGTPLLTRGALTGDITAAQGSNTTVLATVNSNVGTFGSATQVGQFTVNAKGLITAASNVSISVTSGSISDFVEAAQDAIGAMIDGSLVYADATPLLSRAALTGDITAAQGSNTTVLATVNANVGTFGSATQVGQFTVNAKGLITAASNVSISVTSAAITDFVEAAQDATGAMATDGTLVYVDATPLLTRGAISGDITIAQGSNTAAITAGVIVNADVNASAAIAFSKLATMAGLSVLGVTGNVTTTTAAITAGSDNQVLRRSGTALAFGAINLASANAVTGDLPFANLAQGSGLSVLGVTGGSTADVASIAGTANQVLRVDSAGTALAFGQINLAAAAAVTGALGVGNGGTGLTAGTSGGVPYFSATNTMASSALLAANKIVIGGGAGAAPATTGVNIDSNNNLSLFGPTINAQTGTTYTLLASDTGKIIECNNASPITVTLPDNLNNFCCRIVQTGAGRITLTPSGGATLNNRYSFTKSSGLWSELDLYISSNSGGSSAVYIMTGDGST